MITFILAFIFGVGLGFSLTWQFVATPLIRFWRELAIERGYRIHHLEHRIIRRRNRSYARAHRALSAYNREARKVVA